MAKVIRRPVFGSVPVPVRGVTDRVALGHVFLQVLSISLSVSFHQCYELIFFYMLLLTTKKSERSLGTFHKSNALSDVRG
jgi:hypothetical protein